MGKIQWGDESGLTIIETIIAATVLSIILLSVATLHFQSARQTELILNLSEIKIFRLKLIQAIRHDEAWRKSMTQPQNAAAMNCLRAPNSVCPTVGYDPVNNPSLAIFNAAGLDDETYYRPGGPVPGAIFDATQPGNGITLKGKKCTGFSASTPTPNCPLRFNLRWYALSNTASPLVAVYANLQISPNTVIGLDPNNYSIGYFVGNTASNPIIRSAQ